MYCNHGYGYVPSECPACTPSLKKRKETFGDCSKCKKPLKAGHSTPYLDAPVPCGCGVNEEKRKREQMKTKMREFDTGATRNSEGDKFDYSGFLSPLTLRRYAQYMHGHRKQSDGKMRSSNNWQKGIPLPAYMESLWRHLIDFWTLHDGLPVEEGVTIEDSLCGIIFNASGYLHELRKAALGGGICGEEKEIGRPFACEPDVPVRKAVR